MTRSRPTTTSDTEVITKPSVTSRSSRELSNINTAPKSYGNATSIRAEKGKDYRERIRDVQTTGHDFRVTKRDVHSKDFRVNKRDVHPKSQDFRVIRRDVLPATNSRVSQRYSNMEKPRINVRRDNINVSRFSIRRDERNSKFRAFT